MIVRVSSCGGVSFKFVLPLVQPAQPEFEPGPGEQLVTRGEPFDAEGRSAAVVRRIEPVRQAARFGPSASVAN